jgi:hypothetical protein
VSYGALCALPVFVVVVVVIDWREGGREGV